MKLNKLALLLPVFALAACGAGAKTLTLEETATLATALHTANSAEDVVLPTAITLEQTDNFAMSEDGVEIYAAENYTKLIADTETGYFYITGTEYGESFTQSLWQEGSKVYLAQAFGEAKEYMAIDAGTEAAALQVMLSVFAETGYAGAIESATGIAELEAIINWCETITALTDEDPENDAEHNMGYTDYNVTWKATSKNDTSVKLEVELHGAGEDEYSKGTVDGVQAIEFTNGYLTYFLDSATIADTYFGLGEDGADSTSSITSHQEVKISYTATPVEFDLTGYTETVA